MGANVGCLTCKRSYHVSCGMNRGVNFVWNVQRAFSLCWICTQGGHLFPELELVDLLSNVSIEEAVENNDAMPDAPNEAAIYAVFPIGAEKNEGDALNPIEEPAQDIVAAIAIPEDPNKADVQAVGVDGRVENVRFERDVVHNADDIQGACGFAHDNGIGTTYRRRSDGRYYAENGDVFEVNATEIVGDLGDEIIKVEIQDENTVPEAAAFENVVVYDNPIEVGAENNKIEREVVDNVDEIQGACGFVHDNGIGTTYRRRSDGRYYAENGDVLEVNATEIVGDLGDELMKVEIRDENFVPEPKSTSPVMMKNRKYSLNKTRPNKIIQIPMFLIIIIK